jgi:hypothetical protein
MQNVLHSQSLYWDRFRLSTISLILGAYHIFGGKRSAPQSHERERVAFSLAHARGSDNTPPKNGTRPLIFGFV